jgi:hypothetical protein
MQHDIRSSSHPSHFFIHAGAVSTRVQILPNASSALVRCMIDLLPFGSELHYTKISGEGLYLFVPFFIPPENVTHVSTLSRGTVAYWPNRQLLLIYYGNFEKEDAGVMLLGRIDKGLDEISSMGKAVKTAQRQPVQLAF